MTFVLGTASRREMQGLHPFLIELAEEAIRITPQDFTVFDGLRTEAEQRALVARGASQTLTSKHRRQPDGFGHAVDLVPWINGRARWEWPPIFVVAAAVRQAAATVNARRRERALREHRLVWGGVWDRPFESLGESADDMRRAVDGYVARRRAQGKSAFIDGQHWELAA